MRIDSPFWTLKHTIKHWQQKKAAVATKTNETEDTCQTPPE